MGFVRKAIVAFSFVSVASFALPAKAGLLVEPYAGYNLGVVDLSVPAVPSLSVKADLTGPVFGARLGYSIPMFWFGVDYSIASLTSKVTSGTGTVDNGTATAMFAVVGVELPVLLRGWAGYGLSYEFKGDGDPSKADAMKFGVGFTGFPIISVNLEYMTQTFKDVGAGVSLKGSTLTLGVSAPFDF